MLRALLTVDASVPTFVCGDMNFIEAPCRSSLPTQVFAKVWRTFKDRFRIVDVDHDAHTFFHVTKDVTSPFSWSSRVVFFPSSCLSCFFAPSVSSSSSQQPWHWGFHSPLSGHLPLRLGFSCEVTRIPGRPTIPRWVAEAPAFVDAVRKQ